MSDPTIYDIISHLDESPRYLGLSLDELLIGATGVMLLVISSHKILVGLFSFGLYSIAKYLKRGNGPRYFLVLIYWHWPHAIAQMVVPKLPPSHLRVWRA